eukprot:SAG31_NODE_3459_length_4250_cov_1.437244_5_plen_115_part_00
MLQTDLHKKKDKRHKKMTPAEFVKNSRTPNTIADKGCSEDRMYEIYERIKRSEIKLSGQGLLLKPKQTQHDLPDWLLGHVVVKSLWQHDEDNPCVKWIVLPCFNDCIDAFWMYK